MSLCYLKENRSIVWVEMVMKGKLYSHLLERMMPGMEDEVGHRGLKAHNPMCWVRRMSYCKA